MTNEQRAALEALAGRPLTPEEVAQITPLLADPRRDDLIAGILSLNADGTPRMRNVEIEAWRAVRYFAKRSLWRGIVELANTAGHPAQAAGQAAADLASVAGMMIDLADPDEATTMMWAGLIAAGRCTAADRDTLQSWCREPAPISTGQVSDALNAVEV